MSDRETVGFVGLGAMGLPMASNLLKAGFGLRVYNRTASKATPLVEQGAILCSSPGEAATGVRVIISMLADDAAVEYSTVEDEGILNALTPDSIHLSMSTIAPTTAKRLSALHDLHDSVYLGCPVYGRPPVAEAGKLWLLLSGDPTAKETVTEILLAMGQRIFDFGDDPGAAHVAKVCGNFMIGAAIEAMGEAFTLAEKNGVSREALYEMLTESVFGSVVHKAYGKLIATETYEPAGFTLPLGQKDIELAQTLARESQTPLPMGGIVHDRILAARAKGRDRYDWAVLAQEASESAGLPKKVRFPVRTPDALDEAIHANIQNARAAEKQQALDEGLPF